jgi:PAS domain S-box-containing protein
LKNLLNLLSSNQQQQLLALLISGPDFVSLSSKDGIITYVNDAGRNMLGLASLDEAKRPGDDFLMPAEPERLKDEITDELCKKGTWTGRVNYRHFKTGDAVPMHGTTMLIYDEETGAGQGWATIARDLRAEISGQEQQRKLMTLAENSIDLMSVLELNGVNSYINPAGRKMLGIAADEDISKIPITSFHTDEQLFFVENEILPGVMSFGRWSGRFAIKNIKTGEIIPLENNCIRIDDPNTGQPVGVGAIMRDLRSELAAQDAIRQSEMKFRQMIMEAPVAIALVEGPDLKIVASNPLMLQFWRKDESVIGLSFKEALPELEDQGFRQMIERVSQTGETFNAFEAPARLQRNGQMEESYYNFVVAHIGTLPSGEHSVILVATDVSEQVAARKTIEQSEKRFRSLILEAPMPTALYTGDDLVIEVANEAMIKLWGKDGSVIGKRLIDAVPELEGQHFIHTLKKVFHTGEAYHTDQEKADLFVGGRLQSFWFNYTYKPLHDAAGKVYGILNMATDVTKLIHLQQQKDEFIGIASHELKTPVTSIKAYAQVLEAIFREKGYEKESKMLTRMGVQIDRLTNLISDLLDTTKIQAGKLMFNERIFGFNQVVEEVVEDMRRTTSKHEITVTLSKTDEVFADPERISQVLTNLLSNAIKYSPNADKICVSTSVTDEFVKVCVKDFGVGIPADKHEKVFEQFYRVSGDKQHTFPGLGLGLYISSEIVKREGGRIWVESIEGKGSNFCFTLPRNTKTGE